MAFWHATYRGRLYDIQYENLTLNPEKETRNQKPDVLSRLGMAEPVLGFSQEQPDCQNRFEHAGAGKAVYKKF